ncbi:Pimeloyl-ACP methyl ester carboxylesterase [Polynucleobacter meluiroseus]|uniref:Pimeloyl-ACP methyl ester carboxylesterase n=1 Tax=Polynucleobacter meluiroseus TaxID=1938814 RepID=A0A240E301_9BURK|nr:alpha/beta fold hydrolase [Polynucleobacter meluiroseus]SNX29587.1 Pimeloyl-ACP methyl ester carboxylesterase [Polynucleobacter meluiroseus]
MKKKIFNVLMEAKVKVIQWIRPPNHYFTATVAQVVQDTAALTTTQSMPLEGNLEAPPVTPIRAVSIAPETRYFQIRDEQHPRKIAYTVSGDMNAENILVCLPGLLETKTSFLVIHDYFLRFENYKVISVDFSGRGESDYIDECGAYKMSLYLSDVSELIQGAILVGGKSYQRLTILGTSMGGVLAMYLTKIFDKKIHAIVLNDIALTINWTALYTLYKSMKNELGFKEIQEFAKELSVDEKAIADVQLPGHFDLSYRADVWGMNFHEALEGFKGKVGLVYGGESKICTEQRVQEIRALIPRLNIFEVLNAGHPVPFDDLVCDFIHSQMSLRPMTRPKDLVN